MKLESNVENPQKMKNYAASFEKLASHNNGLLLQTNQKKG
jgi:hypothetical protein